ncbi:Pr6Pr family membrane protein [Microbacterium hominis]|uniref:Pr6Pr family membrane protein n=1 Tax=Microbacterium hominis TaxID=162426 RepID=A0A7D4UJD0_9MICO|nr:Pr6Pr family membrane protein [Microbacterium hominis]QKJ20948.1 Pr6Pr family membrane protein [Microbacterium hominis]
MAIPLRPLALAYRIVAVVLIAAGIIRLLGLFSPDPSWSTLLYFTALSNVLALVWMTVVALATARDLVRRGARGLSNPSPEFHGAVMMAITVTMLVYTVVLVPSLTAGGSYVPYTLTDSLVHVITPILVVADWLLFTPKGRMRWVDPLLWGLIPWGYLAFAFVFGALGGEFAPGKSFPYPFMDVAALGLGGVALWIVALTVALEAVGFVYVAVDRALFRVGRRARDETGMDAAPRRTTETVAT